MMALLPGLPGWTVAAPLLAAAVLGSASAGLGAPYALVMAAALVAAVLTAVHHAEVVAHRVGEQAKKGEACASPSYTRSSPCG